MTTQEKVQIASEMRRAGATYQQIAHRLGVSRQRACQITQVGARQDLVESVWGFRFSVRTMNCLAKMAITKKEDAMVLYQSGHLRPNIVRGFGIVSFFEVCRWLGVPPTVQNLCRNCGKPTSSACS